MRPRKMTEPVGHSDACKWWQTLGNCTNGKHHLQAAAKPRASRQKRTPNGRYRSPDRRESAYRRVGQWRGGYRAPRRSPKRASARARAPALRRGQRSGRKSHSNPMAMMEPKNVVDAPKGGLQSNETPWRVRRGKRKRQPRTRSRGKGGPTPRRGRRKSLSRLRAQPCERVQTERVARAPTGGEGAKGDGWGCRAFRRTRAAT